MSLSTRSNLVLSQGRRGKGKELLWSDAQSQAVASGKQQDFAVSPQTQTGGENPSTLSKSNSGGKI